VALPLVPSYGHRQELGRERPLLPRCGRPPDSAALRATARLMPQTVRSAAVPWPMRFREVDERDSSWENDHPVFRVYLFRGGERPNSSWTTWTYDVEDGDVLDVAQWAQTKVGDSGLYAIALVSGETAEGSSDKGLIWLIGNDANAEPCTDREIAAHGRMAALRGQRITYE